MFPLKHQTTPRVLRNLVKDRLLKAMQFCPDNFGKSLSANPTNNSEVQRVAEREHCS